MSSESKDTLHKLGIDIPELEGDDVRNVELTTAFLQDLALVYKEMDGGFRVLCTEDAPLGIFRKDKTYPICSMNSRSMCVVGEKDNHAGIGLHQAGEHFVLRATDAQLAGIRGMVEIARQERIGKLRELAKTFTQTTKFEVLDEVVWKDGMCNCVRPSKDEIAVVLEVLPEPIRGSDLGAPDAGARNDIVVGVIDDDGGLLHYVMDSRRFQHAKKEA